MEERNRKEKRSLERGYKGLAIKLIDKEVPRLCSPSQEYFWKPGVNVSSFHSEHGGLDPNTPLTESLKKTFETTGAGFYCLSTPKEVAEQGYWTKVPRVSPILAQLAPQGISYPGSRGWRSSHAAITELYQDDVKCDFCKGGNAKYVLPQSNSDLTGSWLACPDCYKYIISRIKKTQKPQQLEVSKVYGELESYYQVPVLPVQKHFRD